MSNPEVVPKSIIFAVDSHGTPLHFSYLGEINITHALTLDADEIMKARKGKNWENGIDNSPIKRNVTYVRKVLCGSCDGTILVQNDTLKG